MCRLVPDFSPPSPHPSDKGPILAPRPLNPKWTSLSISYMSWLAVVHRPRFRFLTRPPPLSLGVYSLSSRTRAFNHERNTIAVSPCSSSSALDGSREPGRDVGS